TSAERRAAALPPLAADCVDDGRSGHEHLAIEGLDDRATLAAAPGATRGLRLSLRAVGSDARIRWLLDGRLVGESVGGGRFEHDFGEPGTHTLTALAETGAWARVEFRVLPPTGR
ncbi:penicillin-binding protein 1C, partial [Lysobacter aestuarii]